MIALHKVPVLVWKEGDVYIADCPPLRIASQGVDEAEAVLNLKEAIELYFEDLPFPELPQIDSAHFAELELAFAS